MGNVIGGVLFVVQLLNQVQVFATLWTVACQASLSGRGLLQARILEHIVQYLLEHYISCCPSHQSP